MSGLSVSDLWNEHWLAVRPLSDNLSPQALELAKVIDQRAFYAGFLAALEVDSGHPATSLEEGFAHMNTLLAECHTFEKETPSGVKFRVFRFDTKTDITGEALTAYMTGKFG